MKNNKILNELIADKAIKDYRILKLDKNGEIGESDYRNTEMLVVEFPNGKKVEISAFVSGSLQNATLLIEGK